jgi:hypothetical protein
MMEAAAGGSGRGSRRHPKPSLAGPAKERVLAASTGPECQCEE